MDAFLLGFIIGAAASAGVVLANTPQSGQANRQGIIDRVNTAMQAGKDAAAVEESVRWAEFRQRLADLKAQTNRKRPEKP